MPSKRASNWYVSASALSAHPANSGKKKHGFCLASLVLLFVLVLGSYPRQALAEQTVLTSKILSETRIIGRTESSSEIMRDLQILVSGPAVFETGREDSLTIYIKPVNTAEQIQTNNPNIIKHIDLAIITSDNSVLLGPWPKYYVKNNGQDEEQLLEDMSEEWRSLYSGLGVLGDFAMSFTGKVGILYKLVKLAHQTTRYASFSDPVWADAWRHEFDHDIFPLPHPFRVKGGRPTPEYYKIVVPFRLLDDGAEISLAVNQVEVSSLWPTIGDTSIYSLDDPIIIKEAGWPPTPPMARLKEEQTLIEDHIALAPNLNMSFDAHILNESGTNFLEITLLPEMSDRGFYEEHYELLIMSSKGSFLIPAFPDITSANQQHVHVQSNKNALAGDLLRNWLSFGFGTIAGFQGGAMKDIATGHSGLQLIENVVASRGDLSFYESIQNNWLQQNTYNTFLFPPVKNNITGSRGVTYRIPVQFTDMPFFGRAYVRATLSPEFVRPRTPTSSTTFSSSSTTHDFYFDIQPRQAVAENAPLIGFLIDTSGSMSWTDPKNIRHSALKMIIDRLQGNEKVFIVDFDSQAKWINPQAYENWNREQLKRYVDMLGARGGTNIGAGLDKMRDVLQPHMTADNPVGVLLFTDGMGRFSNNDQWFIENNIPVYTVGYQAEADAALMQRIATNTNGVFLLAANEHEIAHVFTQFLNTMQKFDMLFSKQDEIAQDQTIEYSFYVDENTKSLNVNCSWLGSKIGLLLRAPGGLFFREGGRGRWFGGRNYTSVNLDNPPAGQWTAVLSGEEIPGETEPFTFQVSGESPARFSVRSRVAESGMIHLELLGEGEAPPVDMIQPTISVLTPDNQLLDLSGRFANGQLQYFPMSGEGGYRFDLAFDATTTTGGRIQRHLVSSVYVGDHQPPYIAPISQVMGNFLTVPIGRHQGNRGGIYVQIYRAGGDLSEPIGRGYVSSVTADQCVVSVQYTSQSIAVGDIVVLDVVQWESDQL